MVNGLNTWVPKLLDNIQLVHISDGISVSDEMIKNVLSAKQNRRKAMNYFLDRFTGPNPQVAKYNDPITKQPILRFEDSHDKKENTR